MQNVSEAMVQEAVANTFDVCYEKKEFQELLEKKTHNIEYINRSLRQQSMCTISDLHLPGSSVFVWKLSNT